MTTSALGQQPLTDENRLVAYVEGIGFGDVAPILRARLKHFIAEQPWKTNQVLYVDEQYTLGGEGDDPWPEWTLGINLGLDHRASCLEWIDGIEALVRLLESLATETDQSFELFVAYASRRWLQNFLLSVDRKPTDLPWLKEAIIRIT